MGFFDRLKEGLKKTREGFVKKIENLGIGKPGEATLEELEEILITADTGVATALALTDRLRAEMRGGKIKTPAEIKVSLREQMREMLRAEPAERELRLDGAEPAVIMIVGVNGVGKTTTIAKLAHHLKNSGRKVLLAAGDTFRAAAADQLTVWGNRTGVPVIRHQEGSDPAAVVYDALAAAKARGMDTVIVDTAGRLHTKVNLMEELKKIKRVIGREIPGAPQETLLVLDATTGQNAISQAQLFHAAVDLTGLVLTKLDGTAKGGIVIAVQEMLSVPLKFIGVGEGMEDLKPFDADEFIDALFAAE